jgi:hypothetical protein
VLTQNIGHYPGEPPSTEGFELTPESLADAT